MTSSGKSCEQCPKGQYQNQSGQVACESCPPGTSTLAVGSSSLSQCLGTMMVTWNFSEQCFIKLMALLSERTILFLVPTNGQLAVHQISVYLLA